MFLDSLQFCQKNKGLEIHAWCIMSNHVHLVFRSINGQNPELLVGDLKRFTSQSIVKSIKENPRESRKEFLLDFFKKEAKFLELKIDYVHNNPVEEGLVYKAEDYVYSSAIDYSGQKGLVDDVVVFRMFGV